MQPSSPPSPPHLHGVNYGGRFVPERWLGLPGMQELYGNATAAGSQLSTCDMAVTAGAGRRMLNYLNASIRENDFASIAMAGFNLVRLPLGYWHLVQPRSAPDAPAPTASRWEALQAMLPPDAYAPYIERVLSFSRAHGLRVLLDLHGAPGGQSTNQCTGCATKSSEERYFDREANMAVAVQAITVMAQLCEANADTCYGIELLNEPQINLDRRALLGFYQRAIRAARGAAGLRPSAPIVVMDWVLQLDTFWTSHKDVLGALVPQARGAGAIQFETHIYVPFDYHSIGALELQALPMLALLRRFAKAAGANYPTFIGEWALSRASGALSLEQVARWWYREAAQSTHSLGLAIWNFDGPGAWGAVVANRNGSARSWWLSINHGAVGEY